MIHYVAVHSTGTPPKALQSASFQTQVEATEQTLTWQAAHSSDNFTTFECSCALNHHQFTDRSLAR